MLSLFILAGIGYYLYNKENKKSVTHPASLPNTAIDKIEQVTVNTNLNKFDINNENKLKDVTPELSNKVRQLLAIAKSNGYQLYIDEGYRTQARQNQLYAQGRTTAGQIVTWTRNSKHTQRKAVDVMPVINSKPSNDLKLFNWNLLGIWAKQVGLIWGGNWKQKDYRHLEI